MKRLYDAAVKALYGAAIAGVVALILVHGLAPGDFTVDSTTVALILVLGVIVGIPFMPLLTRYITELTIMGNTIKFREQVERAEEQLKAVKAAEQARTRPGPERAEDQLKRRNWPGFLDVPAHLYDLIEQDPRLAVAGLGIEVERVLREAANRITEYRNDYPERSFRSLVGVIRYLESREVIDSEQAVLLLQMVELRNLAVHGREITKEDAYRFFSIIEQLNDSVGLGYSVNFSPNEAWQEQGLTCKFEHCIERMPLKDENWDGSCGLFGHDCPGGAAQVTQCAQAGLFDNVTPP